MKKLKFYSFTAIAIIALLLISNATFAQEALGNNITSLLDGQKYSRAIHIMAMLLIGFGFLMVFVRKYGRSALTATFLLVSVSIPLYMIIKKIGIFGHSNLSDIDFLIFAEFAAASLLITTGAILGRVKMHQYIILTILFIPAYMLNEWIILENGFGLINVGTFIDTGGSIVIHAFGALYGISAALSLTTKKQFEAPIEADSVSDRFSLLGSMVLWVFWPSFCAAIVAPELITHTAVNVILALCGSTAATYVMTITLRNGKINTADIANATLAGGVAIGSACDSVSATTAIIIGLVAGAISTFGFAVIQSKFQKGLKFIDTCGVFNLHGLPGLFGGLVAILVVANVNPSVQLLGIFVTIVISIITGLISGKIISLFGKRKIAYNDAEEFEDAEE